MWMKILAQVRTSTFLHKWFVLIRRQATNVCWRLTNKPITSHIHNVNKQTGYKYYFIHTFRRPAFLRWPRSKVRASRDFDRFFSLSVLLRKEEEETAFCHPWILPNTDASTLNITFERVTLESQLIFRCLCSEEMVSFSELSWSLIL